MRGAEACAAKHTPLYASHVALGGKMVEFAGYALPVQYGGADGGAEDSGRDHAFVLNGQIGRPAFRHSTTTFPPSPRRTAPATWIATRRSRVGA